MENEHAVAFPVEEARQDESEGGVVVHQNWGISYHNLAELYAFLVDDSAIHVTASGLVYVRE